MAKLREVILLLIDGTPLPARYKDRSLGGERSRNTFGFVLNAPVATNM
jgi:mRNA-degrading endonuclease YafQ of YafQ-DinJ toxin-antitoxin module